MSRTAGVALGVVAVLAGLAIGAIPAQSQPGQRTTFTALDKDSDDRAMEVDNNRKGPSAGDTFGFTSPLLDPEDRTTKVGSLKAMCTALTFARKSGATVMLCHGTSTFEEGMLTFQGSLKFSRNTEGATMTLTGGTDEYEGAAGTVTLEFQDDGALTTFDFTTNN